MRNFSRCLWGIPVVVLCLIVLSSSLSAQVIVIEGGDGVTILPHPRPRPIPPGLPRPAPIPAEMYRVESVNYQIRIKDQHAQTQVSQVLKNTGSATLQAKVFLPVPDSAAVSGLTLLVDGKELAGKLLDRESARRIYEETVRRSQDPALLEYVGQGLYQTSVFPIPPQAQRTVEIRFSQLLRLDNGLVDLLLPLGTTKHAAHPIANLNVDVRIETSDKLKAVYSPTHKLEISRPDDTHAVCKLALQNVHSPDDLRLLFGTQSGLVGMHLVSYRPDDKEDGYFLLLANPEVRPAETASVDKTLILVIDRSGSMSGQKIDQARAALTFVLRQLRPGDTFNIVAYDSVVENFRPELQRADTTTIQAAVNFVDGLHAGGSTNIDGALQAALKQITDKTRPSYVLFLTDGLPTAGEQNEQLIARNAEQANSLGARLFAFGVGYDVNSRLLDRLSHAQRGLSIYVRPNENIEAAVSSLYAKISTPLLTDLALKVELDAASGSTGPVNRLYPKQLTDLFQGEQLVLVGRYRQSGAAKVTLTGTVGGEKREFTVSGNLVAKSADETTGYVEKLWAVRRIGELIDELDLHGKNKELVDELVQLSMKHGILTPYTAFLADEGARLASTPMLRQRTSESLSRNLNVFSGKSGVAQRSSKNQMQNATDFSLNKAAGGSGIAVQDAEGVQRDVNTVRVVGQKAFYLRNNRWEDSSVKKEEEQSAKKIKQFSSEYFELASKHRGEFGKYLAIREPVTVKLDGTVYQIEPAEPVK